MYDTFDVWLIDIMFSIMSEEESWSGSLSFLCQSFEAILKRSKVYVIEAGVFLALYMSRLTLELLAYSDLGHVLLFGVLCFETVNHFLQIEVFIKLWTTMQG